MSSLVPNLEDLRHQVEVDSGNRPVHEFMNQLATANSIEDVDTKIDALVDGWLGAEDDHDN